MGGVMAAYLLSLGVITVRWFKGPKQPPPPMAFLGASIIFAASGLLAQADKRLGTIVAWAFLAGAVLGPKLPPAEPIQMMFGAVDLGSMKPGENLLGQAPPGTTTEGMTPNPKYRNPDAPDYHPPVQER